ncbi:MAG: hypothetical protein WKG01_04000 [Kofleriaceae bacterium]
MKLYLLALLWIVPACKGNELDARPAPAPSPVVTPLPDETPTPDPERAPTEPVTRQVLADFGYQLEVPASWTLVQLNQRAYTFRIPSVKQGGMIILSRLDLSRMPLGPKTLEAATKPCAGTIGDTGKLAGGAFYYTCSQQVAGHTIQNFRLVIPGEENINCDGSGPDISATLAVCRSLRPIDRS